MKATVEPNPRQVVARVFDEFVDRLLSSNDPNATHTL